MERDDTVAAYVMNLSLVSTTESADILISVEDRIQECGGEYSNSTFAWCGRVLSSESKPEEPERLRIAGAYNQSSTQTIAKSGLGYLYGVQNPTSLTDIASLQTLRPADPFFGDGPVVVGINNTASPERNFSSLVSESLSWWESQPRSYKNYSASFKLRRNATNPDIEVRFVDHIPPETCAGEPDDVLGCADILSGEYFVESALVRIEAGYTNQSTLRTIKHEFGHIHGRRHNQSPLPLMSPTGGGTLLPQPNATERPLPWQSPNLTYYLTSRSAEKVSSGYAKQVRHAMDYYEEGAEGHVPQNVTLTRTDNRSAADIVIIEESTNATRGSGSIAYKLGQSTDADAALEYYTSDTIYLSDLQTDRYGWHTGYWLGFAFGADNVSELPPPFDEPSEDPRENWW